MFSICNCSSNDGNLLLTPALSCWKSVRPHPRISRVSPRLGAWRFLGCFLKLSGNSGNWRKKWLEMEFWSQLSLSLGSGSTPSIKPTQPSFCWFTVVPDITSFIYKQGGIIRTYPSRPGSSVLLRSNPRAEFQHIQWFFTGCLEKL